MLLVLLIFILLQTSKIHANLEDYLISDIGEEFLYPDAIEEKPRRNQEVESTKRRTGGDSNFVRFGRSDKISAFDEDVDYDDLEFLVRPTRSKTNPTDRHLRFGRSKPSFIRFGRTDPKSSFLRFGRSSSDYQRSKRDVYDSPQQSTSKGASNFVRFGRNDYFMRFGREKLADRIRLPPTKPSTDDVRNLEGGRYGVRGQLRSEIRAQLKRLMMEGERFKGPERFVKVLGRIEGDVKE